MKKSVSLLTAICMMLFLSCGKEKNNEPEDFSVGKGLFVLNEGNYTNSTASLSFYDFEKNEIENNLFYRVNNAPLGDVAQSLTLVNDNLYVVVNNSKDIYKLDAKTLKYKSNLGEFVSPRYMLPVSDDKAYVTDLSYDNIWVINPMNMTHTKLINTGKSTEVMVRIDNEVYVANWSKFYVPAPNNTIQVIDCVNDSLIAEIEVAPEPNAMVVDKNNHIWVLCSGGYEDPYEPALICVDPETRSIIHRFDFASGNYPDGMDIDGEGENIYYLNGGFNSLDVYKISVDNPQISETPFIASEGRWIYNIAVNPQNGDVYVTEAQPTSNGKLWRYSSAGAHLGTFDVGIFPSYMLFN